MIGARSGSLQGDMKEVEMKKQKVIKDGKEAHEKTALEYAKLEEEQLLAAEDLEKEQLRYSAETQRDDSNERMNHANNLMKLLTHLGDPEANKEKPSK